MIEFDVLTLFPGMFDCVLGESIIGRAIKNNIISVKPVNIRDFSVDRHSRVDDYPYGGGTGMVMQPQPIYDAYRSLMEGETQKYPVIYLTPQGRRFNQDIAEALSREKRLLLLCGHYEGVDERIVEEIVTDEISIGDYVMTGGELAAMVLIDAVSRLVPGVLSGEESHKDETFYSGLLEYPQYTRPPDFMGRRVPDILLSGHHANIEKWHREQSIIRTYERRPDLLEGVNLKDEDLRILERISHEKQMLAECKDSTNT